MIVPGICSSCKLDWMRGIHQPQDEYMIALYMATANLDPMSVAKYTPEGECKSTGYNPGGTRLIGFQAGLDGTTAVMGWAQSPEWQNVTLSARGALIYNKSKQNKAMAIIEFPQDYTATNGRFFVPMPPLTSTTALIWIA